MSNCKTRLSAFARRMRSEGDGPANVRIAMIESVPLKPGHWIAVGEGRLAKM